MWSSSFFSTLLQRRQCYSKRLFCTTQPKIQNNFFGRTKELSFWERHMETPNVTILMGEPDSGVTTFLRKALSKYNTAHVDMRCIQDMDILASKLHREVSIRWKIDIKLDGRLSTILTEITRELADSPLYKESDQKKVLWIDHFQNLKYCGELTKLHELLFGWAYDMGKQHKLHTVISTTNAVDVIPVLSRMPISRFVLGDFSKEETREYYHEEVQKRITAMQDANLPDFEHVYKSFGGRIHYIEKYLDFLDLHNHNLPINAMQQFPVISAALQNYLVNSEHWEKSITALEQLTKKKYAPVILLPAAKELMEASILSYRSGPSLSNDIPSKGGAVLVASSPSIQYAISQWLKTLKHVAKFVPKPAEQL